MKVLIACEESQVVCKAFKERGHEAYSNDLVDCSGGHPEWHLKMDCREAIKLKEWDLIIIHTPCTYTCLSGNRWYYNSPKRKEGAEFTREVLHLALTVCSKVVLEQPKSMMGRYIGKPTQKIQPYLFGHPETKETWFWIFGLPLLKATNEVEGRKNRIWRNIGPGKNRSKIRSKTYPGIAKAMAEQWGASPILANPIKLTL